MKRQLRNEILKIREKLCYEEVSKKSEMIFENLINSQIYKNSHNIFIYLNFRNEVRTDLIINHALSETKNNSPKKIFIPLCNTAIKEIILCEMISWEDLAKNKMGILEPRQDKIRIANRKVIDLAIVPGSVFDKQGNRIGYGAGYYDKFFSSLKKDIIKIGLCYDFQVIDSVPSSSYDVPMDYIITESGKWKT